MFFAIICELQINEKSLLVMYVNVDMLDIYVCIPTTFYCKADLYSS